LEGNWWFGVFRDRREEKEEKKKKEERGQSPRHEVYKEIEIVEGGREERKEGRRGEVV
jgi:hypothetical protein